MLLLNAFADYMAAVVSVVAVVDFVFLIVTVCCYLFLLLLLRAAVEGCCLMLLLLVLLILLYVVVGGVGCAVAVAVAVTVSVMVLSYREAVVVCCSSSEMKHSIWLFDVLLIISQIPFMEYVAVVAVVVAYGYDYCLFMTTAVDEPVGNNQLFIKQLGTTVILQRLIPN